MSSDVLETELTYAAEIEAGRLYFVCVHGNPAPTPARHFFTVPLEYTPLEADFGPVDISVVVSFCRTVKAMLKEYPKDVLYFYTSHSGTARANGAFLAAAYSVLVLGCSGDDAFRPFIGAYPPLLPFRDAAPGPSTVDLHLVDCLRAVHKARALRWVDVDRFDVEAFRSHSKLENGGWTWVVPGKLIAFPSPRDHTTYDEETGELLALSTGDYVGIFKPLGVRDVVRLVKPTYNGQKFSCKGIAHHDIIFAEEDKPGDVVMKAFVDLVEAAETKGTAVAVHCQAGRGRTGTLLGCTLIKHYGFTAAEAIAYLRLVRPGSVVGGQQQFLAKAQARLLKQGEGYRRRAAAAAAAAGGATVSPPGSPASPSGGPKGKTRPKESAGLRQALLAEATAKLVLDLAPNRVGDSGGSTTTMLPSLTKDSSFSSSMRSAAGGGGGRTARGGVSSGSLAKRSASAVFSRTAALTNSGQARAQLFAPNHPQHPPDGVPQVSQDLQQC
eukprot:RCo018648